MAPSNSVHPSQQTTQPKVEDLIKSKAKKYGLKENILKGVVATESSFRPSAVNLKDGRTKSHQSVGLMQIKPATAKSIGFTGTAEHLKKPDVNIEFGAKYLAKQLERYQGDYNKALSAYNAGHATPKNLNYVNKVLKSARKFSRR